MARKRSKTRKADQRRDKRLLEGFSLSFGVHNYKQLHDVPLSYLQWARKNMKKIPDIDHWAICKYLKLIGCQRGSACHRG